LLIEFTFHRMETLHFIEASPLVAEPWRQVDDMHRLIHSLQRGHELRSEGEQRGGGLAIQGAMAAPTIGQKLDYGAQWWPFEWANRCGKFGAELSV